MPAVFDIYDSATNTEIVNLASETALETNGYVGPSIAPLVPVQDNRIKLGRIQIEAFGVAQIVARNAAPAIFVPSIDYDEKWVELAKMDEQSPIEEDEWEALTGTNEYLKLRVGVAILDRARIMQLRAERKTEQMRWAAFHDALVLTVAESGATAQTFGVTYDQPSGNRPSGSNWNTRSSSTPITDIRTSQRIPFNLVSNWGMNVYMHSDTWENLQYSKQVADLLKPNASTGTDFFIPTQAQVEALLYGGDVDQRNDTAGRRVRITVTDSGYRAEGQGTGRGATNMTYFLPKDYVLITTGPIVDGLKIAEVPDGRVLVKPSPEASPQWQQGAQNETYFSQSPPYTQFNRQVCKRIPRINVPEALVYLYVGA